MDIFLDLVAWAKANAKDGANIAEFEELVSKAAPPDDAVKAIEYIRAIPSLRSAFDAALNREFDRAYKKYETEVVPEKEKELREAIRKELNPDETPEQKQIRELREKLEAKDRAEAFTIRQNAARSKAKDLGLDPEIAAGFAVHGDQADEMMKRLAEWHKKELDAVKADASRNTYGNKTPKAGDGSPKAIKDMTADEAMEYARQGPQQKAEVMAALRTK